MNLMSGVKTQIKSEYRSCVNYSIATFITKNEIMVFIVLLQYRKTTVI